MAEQNNGQFESRTTEGLPFEDYVRQTLAALMTEQKSLREEMVERFIQLSRQIKQLDKKVDVFILEQIAIKDEWQELRDAQQPKH